jgi:hypothetical protein
MHLYTLFMVAHEQCPVPGQDNGVCLSVSRWKTISRAVGPADRFTKDGGVKTRLCSLRRVGLISRDSPGGGAQEAVDGKVDGEVQNAPGATNRL